MRIQKSHEFKGMLFLWVYDILKFRVLGDLARGQGIDPWVFLFFDMVTVPPFIIGVSRLVNALTGNALAWPRVLGWGGIVIINTVMPYVYAGWAGKAGFSPAAWVIFWALLFLVLANLFRTIRIQVRMKNQATPGRPDPLP